MATVPPAPAPQDKDKGKVIHMGNKRKGRMGTRNTSINISMMGRDKVGIWTLRRTGCGRYGRVRGLWRIGRAGGDDVGLVSKR